jgi:hypothetical protein
VSPLVVGGARRLLHEAGPARPWAARALCKPVTPVLCHWAASRFQPTVLCFIFLFFEYIQILAKFKNLCRIHLNSESYEANKSILLQVVIL